MGSVYVGRAVGTAGFEKLVAIKLIHPELAPKPDLVEMFLNEARIAAGIHHPGVVEILDLGRDADQFYMVMEYVEGDSLAALLRHRAKLGRPLPIEAALQVLMDAAEGLDAAHELTDAEGNTVGLVHRDVSPSNLLVSMAGRTKVLDFGIMWASGVSERATSEPIRGKRAYMAPEQAAGQEIDRRTDVFALGLVAWELLTGEQLLSEPRVRAAWPRAFEVPDVLARRPDLPPGVGPMLAKALAADPEERYATMRDWVRDLRTVLREWDPPEDPREELATAAEEVFTTRVDYIRAAIRNARSGLMPAVPLEVAPDVGSTPALVRPGGRTVWPWLAVAAAAAAVLGMRTGEGPDEPTFSDSAPVERVVTPELRTPGAETRLPEAEGETVTWWFNSQPQGAQVEVDGNVLAEPTPVSIDMPKHPQAVRVRISKPGYRDHELRLAPVQSQNVAIELGALAPATPSPVDPAVEADAPSTRSAPVGRGPRTRRDRTPSDMASSDLSGRPGSPTTHDPGPGPAAPVDPRHLEEMPDFATVSSPSSAPR